MRRIKNVYEKIINFSNLEIALKNASKGKRGRKAVVRVLGNVKEKLTFLQQLLLAQTYEPLPYNKKTIIDRCTSKIREIYVPKFYPDQIVQWALMLQLKPILMRGMYEYSCASIDGRGSSYGVKAVKKWLTTDVKNTKYCLICDVKKFYPSINQNILMQKFNKIIKCQATLNLINKIVKSIPSGLPIGNFTSQWFANFYLQEFDHFVKEQLKIKYYVRYMDDMLFFSGNKRKLHQQQKQIEQFLLKEGLTIKPNWQLFKVASNKLVGRPIDFLGYKFYRNFITMRSKTFLRATRRIRKVSKKPYLTAKDASAILSYNARIKVATGKIIYNNHVKPFINLGRCKFAISRHDKLKAKNKTAQN